MSSRPASPDDASRRHFIASAGAGLTGLALSATALAQSPGTAAAATACRRYQGKVVLITGATSGIGEATAHAFAREGARIFFCGRREERGRQVEKAIRDSGGDATYMRADVREEAQVAAFVARCVEVYGRLDIAFNNAGITGYMGAMDELAVEGIGYYHDIMRTNVDGVLFAMRHELPVMRAAGGGIIVNTGSSLSHKGSAHMAAYAASKHARGRQGYPRGQRFPRRDAHGYPPSLFARGRHPVRRRWRRRHTHGANRRAGGNRRSGAERHRPGMRVPQR